MTSIKEQLAQFHNLKRSADEDELVIDQATRRLKSIYDELVLICPHSESVHQRSTIPRGGDTRRCKICGITDYASEGGTPGDEYNYGFPGHPHKEFWKDSEVEFVDHDTFDTYHRRHDWVVRDGKPYKRFG